LFVGQIAIEKNINLLIETATKLVALCVYTFGTGLIEDEIKNKIKKLNINDRFCFR
jgi:glycosyltransferase involved in cell wall biosynthesis